MGRGNNTGKAQQTSSRASDAESQMKKIEDLLGKQEDLAPELEVFLEDDGPMPMLRHPLVYSIPHSPEMNALVNQQLIAKQDAVLKARDEKRWSTFIMLHERAYRLNAFIAIADEIEADEDWSDAQWWELLGDIWIDSENIYQNYETWGELLSEDRDKSAAMMNEEERETLAAMPDEITVYRGFAHPDADDGYSWTVNRSRAEFFAKRFAGDNIPKVLTGKISKKNVIAYKAGRNEEEIIATPDHVRVEGVVEL